MSKQIATREETKIVPIHEGSAEGLLAKAIEKGATIDTLERLLAMRKELKAEKAREAFYEALSAFQAKCPIIPKTKVAGSGNFRYYYAPLDVIVKTISPILHECGLSFTIQTRLETDPLSQVAICTVHHRDGHSESSEFRAPIDAAAKMNDMQKAASAQTYAKRYALCNALGILTGDDDDDARSVETASSGMSAKQKADFLAAIDGLTNREEAEKLWTDIVRVCNESGDKDAYAELKAKIAEKMKGKK